MSDETELEQMEVPVHGVLVVEGIETGDRRRFAAGALTWRDLPLPLMWPKQSGEGHSGSVIVGRIEELERADDGTFPFSGFMNCTPESAEAVTLIANRDLRGISVDVDSVVMELQTRDGRNAFEVMAEDGDVDENDVVETITSGRASGGTIVPIPAFMEAYIALGPRPQQEAVAASAEFSGDAVAAQSAHDIVADLPLEQEVKDQLAAADADDLPEALRSIAADLEPQDAEAVLAAADKIESLLSPGGVEEPEFPDEDALRASAAEVLAFADIAPGRTEDGDVGTLLRWRDVTHLFPSDTSTTDPTTTSAGLGRAMSTEATTAGSRSVEARLVSRTESQPTGSSTNAGSARSQKTQSSTISATTSPSAPGAPAASTVAAATRDISSLSSTASTSPEGKPTTERARSAATGSTTSPSPNLGTSGLSMEFSEGRVVSVTSVDDGSGIVRLSDGTVLAAGRPLHLFGPTSNPSTMDGPGWLTHPVDTDRLRDYWVRGAGAAKIGWGAPGDFNRCRAFLAEHIKPQYLSGYCANRHFDALGTWPGRRAHSTESLAAAAGEHPEQVAPAYNIVAAAGPAVPPIEWFANPNLTEATPLTITKEGRVFGHVATWGTCHVGFPGSCVTPPTSPSEYAYFLSGVVETTEGDVRVGQITFDTGHADLQDNSRKALAHYDHTGTAGADVMAGEDEHGIWVAGAVRPGVTDDQIRTMRGAKMSGDWRSIGGELEMVAVLAVNTPGFPIPRPALAASAGRQTALVAAGVVPDAEPVERFNAQEIVAETLRQIREGEARAAASAEIRTIEAALAAKDIERTLASVKAED